ncbi:probable G-protein coupled receptor 139, partial [Heterodontus francisci]|uniref:probable G-protein coupled receptor 139 n=1 Tax=Heterodontus francisci TaxID=7792 RepID=UPI00355BB59B
YPVMHQIEDIYYPVIAAIGVAVNLVAIVILSRGKCGLSKCITVHLVGMAVSDLLVVITNPILYWIVLIYFPYSFLRITPVCSLITVLLSASTVVSVWLTVTFTFDRFVAICCEKLKTKYCSEKRASVVVGTVSVLGCLESLPWYFTAEKQYIIDNVPMGCVTKLSFFTSPIWGAFELFDRILTPCVPVFLILLLNVLTVRRILFSSKVRRGFRRHSNAENHKDPEMENRRKSIILLFSISGSFILFWVTRVVYNIYRRIVDIYYYSSDTDPLFITEQTSKMLQILSSCTNTCIYIVTQTKFRQELKKGVKYPLNLDVDAGGFNDGIMLWMPRGGAWLPDLKPMGPGDMCRVRVGMGLSSQSSIRAPGSTVLFVGTCCGQWLLRFLLSNSDDNSQRHSLGGKWNSLLPERHNVWNKADHNNLFDINFITTVESGRVGCGPVMPWSGFNFKPDLAFTANILAVVVKT